MSELLTEKIRAAKPAASPALRERVRAIAAREPEPRPSSLSRLVPGRRFLLVAAPAAVAVAFVSAAVIGVTRSGEEGRDAAVTAIAEAGAPGARGTTLSEALRANPPVPAAKDQAALPPTDPTRLQRYDARLRIRVGGTDELSRATVRAMSIARSLGGYTASVAYSTPERGLGTADLVLRVPASEVQTALLRFSQLGTILAQNVDIEDVQGQVESLDDQILEQQRQIRRLERQLASGALTEDERAVLQQQLAEARRALRDLRSAKASTTQEARLATFSLSLTTAKAAAAGDEGGRLDRTLDEAKSILAWEAAALLYALVVVGPFVAVAALAWLGLRWRRRRQAERLLERR